MAWKLDDIDFSDYGVYVKSSTGVLDLPKMVDESINWLDQNGKDFWQDVESVKYEDGEIVLTCWILESSYSSFKTKVQNFYSALTGSGKRTLTTKFGNEIECYLKDQVQMVRKTSYVSTVQLGFFTIRLIVPGDSKTKPITIYRADGVPHGIFRYGSDAKLDKQLNGSNVITFSIEENKPNSLGRGDYIIFEGEKYIAFEYPEKDKNSKNKYITRLSFSHEFFRLKDTQFRVFNYPESAIWATMDDIVDLVVTMANANNTGLFAKGTIDETPNRNITYSAESCFEVLTRVSGEFSLEWNYRVVDGVIYIDCVDKVRYASSLSLEYGKGNEIHKISRQSTTRENMVTHLFPYGSTKNLPASYGFPRLRLPDEPVVREFYGMRIEDTQFFNDIFPERTGTVTSYTYTPSPDPETYPERAMYKLVDSSMPFDLMEKDESGNTVYLISGTTAKIHFNSGDLAGYEFEVLDYDHATKTFKLVPLKDGRGIVFPNADIHPNTDDEYILLDINLPQSYIDDAVDRLRSAANDYLAIHVPSGVYTDETSPAIYADVLTLIPGTLVHMMDSDFGIDADLRITNITVNLYRGDGSLTLSDFVYQIKRKVVEEKVNAIEKIIDSANMTDINTIRGNEQTAREVRNAVVDPVDEKFKADELIRDESIDQRMLAYESIAPGWHCSSVVEFNYDNNEDKIKVGGGDFTVQSWREFTMTRSEIAKLTEVYDPSRTWIVPETIITLATKAAYYLFAELDTTDESTTCNIVAYEQFKRVREGFDDPGGILRFLLTPITAGEETV